MPKISDQMGIYDDISSKISKSVERVFLKSRQKTFVESISADVYDDIIGILPVVGDVIENGPRIADAVSSKDTLATIVHGADAVITIVPGIGGVLNLLFPTNTILQIMEYGSCKASGESDIDCLFPDGSIERDLMGFAL